MLNKLPSSMLTKGLVRFFRTYNPCTAAEKSASRLAVLRKKTGYTFSNCKKALEINNNDVAKAETWLKEQAQILGWTKATKLEGRLTTQGLVAVTVSPQTATLVEVNCETDFVARNGMFQEMVKEIADACSRFAEEQPKQDLLTKIELNADQLNQLPTQDGKSLADRLALFMGTVGERASLCRALCLKNSSDFQLFGYAHPSGTNKGDTLLGRIGGVVALRQVTATGTNDLDVIGKSLCQHVVGMNPKLIGNVEDKAAENSDDEVYLVHQEFLEDPEVTVHQVLEENGLEVFFFKRFECGETSVLGTERPLELVETCQ